MDSAVETGPRVQRRLAPAVRRRQIVVEATRLISAAGFNAVSLADIAAACDIRKSSVLHHFPSMTDLLSAVLDYRDEQAYPGTLDPERLVGPAGASETFRSSLVHNQEQRELVRLYVMLRAEAFDESHPAHEYFRERERRVLTSLVHALSWKPNPTAAAHELYGLWIGLESLWVADPSVDVLESWDAFASRFFIVD